MTNKKNKHTLLMGILNTTPDSFYEKSRCLTLDKATSHAINLINDGADIIDIGGESSRPNAEIVDEAREIKRVIPVIKKIRNINSKIPISIDTIKPKVAIKAMESGASIINDISGFQNDKMVDVAKYYNCKICVMHMQNSPKTMQINPRYENGIVKSLIRWFENRVESLINKGIDKNNIILDPGIGFGKTANDNLNILKNIEIFKSLGFPILIGISRKSFMAKLLNKKTEDLLPPTLAINTQLIRENVDIIRVHDVKEHKSVIDIINNL